MNRSTVAVLLLAALLVAGIVATVTYACECAAPAACSANGSVGCCGCGSETSSCRNCDDPKCPVCHSSKRNEGRDGVVSCEKS